MADNSVTIALKLDTSEYSRQMSQIKKEIDGMGFKGGKGAGGGGKVNPFEGIADIGDGIKEMGKTEKKTMSVFEKMFGVQLRQVAAGTSMAKGNMSSFNVLAVIEGLLAGMSAVAIVMTAGIALIIIVLISMFQILMGPIFKVLNAIGKVLGAGLMPIAMVMVSILMPFIWFLMPIMRYVRLALRFWITIATAIFKILVSFVSFMLRLFGIDTSKFNIKDLDTLMMGGYKDFNDIVNSFTKGVTGFVDSMAAAPATPGGAGGAGWGILSGITTLLNPLELGTKIGTAITEWFTKNFKRNYRPQ